MHDNCLMKATDLLRRLRRFATKRGLSLVETQAKGSHLKVSLNGRMAIIPVHNKDVPPGTFRSILKMLDLSETDLDV